MNPPNELGVSDGLSPVQQQVLNFAQRQLRLKPRQATIDARLLHDLGLTGRRAESFVRAFSQEFNVNCYARLDREEWNRHFGPERFPRRLPIFLCVSLVVTAMILGGLPIVTVIALMFVAPGYLDGMAADPDGRWLIGGAVVGQIVGNMVIRKIINIQV